MELVYTTTNGCNSALADEGLIRKSIGNEYTLTDDPKDADFLILLGCGVTKYALDDTRRLYDKLTKDCKPGAKVIMSGCASSMDQSVSKGVNPENIVPIKSLQRDRGIGKLVQIGERIPTYEARGRFNIKTNNGCDDACSYCAIPSARGKLRSYTIEGIVGEIMNYIAGKEDAQIGFVGEDIGAYGIDQGRNVVELLRRVNEVEGNFNLRIEVINPRWFVEYEELSDVLIEMAENGRLNPGFGLPLQSASNRVLEAMRRRHTIEEYQAIIDGLNGHVAVSTDILVGFPGETEDDFRETFEFLVRNPFGSPFNFYQVMGYSEMPNTRAAQRVRKVSEEEIKRRMKVISTLLIYQIAEVRGCEIGELTDLPISVNHENLFGGTKNES